MNHNIVNININMVVSFQLCTLLLQVLSLKQLFTIFCWLLWELVCLFAARTVRRMSQIVIWTALFWCGYVLVIFQPCSSVTNLILLCLVATSFHFVELIAGLYPSCISTFLCIWVEYPLRSLNILIQFDYQKKY